MTALNLHGGSAVISSADQLHVNTDAERAEWTRAVSFLAPTLYTLRSGHDMPDPSDQFSDRWAFTAGNLRFVGFYVGGDMSVGATDLAFIEAELIALGGLVPVLVAHHPMSTTFLDPVAAGLGREEMLTFLSTYNVPLYLSGHRHMVLASDFVDSLSTVNVSGPAGMDRNFMVIESYADRIEIASYLYITPYSVASKITVNI